MRFLPLTLLAGLLPLVPANGQSAPTTWTSIQATPSHLAFVRALSDYALTAPASDLPAAFESISSWPEQSDPPSSSAGPFLFSGSGQSAHGRERINRASEVIAYAYTTRATDAAVAYHASLAARSDIEAARFRPGFFAALATIDPARARAELLKISAGSARTDAAQSVLKKLATTDPEKAFALLRELNITSQSTVLETLAALGRIDPKRALASLSEIPAELRSAAENRLLVAWFRASPADAARWVTAHVSKDRRVFVLNQALLPLSSGAFDRLLVLEKDADPDVRAAAAEKIAATLMMQPLPVIWAHLQATGWKGARFSENSNDFGSISIGTLLAFAASQPSDQIKTMFRNLPPDKFKHPYNIHQIVSLWALHDPETALEWAEKIPGAILRNDALVRINSLMIETDPRLAFDQIAVTPPGPFRNELIRATTTALSKKNLRQAIDWVLSLSAGPERTASIETLVHVGVDYDSATLAKAIAGLPPGNVSDDTLYAFGSQWLHQDTAVALDWFVQLPAGPLRTRLGDNFAGTIARFVPERAFDLARTLPDDSERARFIQNLAEFQAVSRLDEVLSLIDTLPAGRNRQFARRSALRAVTIDDPRSAVALLDAGAFGSSRPSSIETIAYTWSQQNPAESAAWLATRLEPRNNDMQLIFGGVGPVAKNYAKESPSAAFAWATSLADPAASRRAQTSVIEQTTKTDPSRARLMLDASTLSDADKSKLLGTAALRP